MKQVIIIMALQFMSIANLTVAQSKIIETPYMREAVAQAQKDDLVVFDLDNTVLQQNQTMGTDQWHTYLLEKLKDPDMSITAWLRVQYLTNVNPVDLDTPYLIQDLQSKGVIVMALTARPLDAISATERQLKSIKVNFSPAAPNLPSLANNKTVRYKNGVIYVGNKNNKGLVLVSTLKDIGIPKRVIFIDDKEKYIKSMEEAFKNVPTQNINYRFSRADDRVKAFSALVAENQWACFNRTSIILNDLQAQNINEFCK